MRVDELTREQEHLAAARTALRRMRERAAELFNTGESVAGDALGAESLGATLARRVAELADNPDVPLFFGKLTQHGGEVHHIGRRHVTDPAGQPMVLDWRAPVSRAFYRASAADPQGVAVRRRFGYAAGVLTSFEDEHLDRGEELGTASRILTAEIERPRVGPMRDIVATIQPEQDALVRADLDTSICVQGAPGTGKTAVGLHRAAYLLYVHRDRLRRSGVLVVGPNRAFLHYIEAVLPALGELDVRQSTIDDLVIRVPVRATDSPATEMLKHDPRMATVLHNALWRRVRVPDEPLVVADGSYRWRVGVPALARVIDEVRREAAPPPAAGGAPERSDALPYATGRERVLARVAALLQRQSELRRGDSPGEAWLRRMSRSRPVTAFLDAAWPAVTAEGLVYELLSDPASLASAADGVLDEPEQRLLSWPKPATGGRPRATSLRTARWSAADALLIDEAAGLLSRMPSYGHVVVDEAQDLSPMQVRAIARRSAHGSVTMLGDLAQGTAAWATTNWRATLARLGKPGAAVVPLTSGFRVPAKVLALANRLLPALAVDVPAAVSLRHDGQLTIRQVPALVPEAVAEVRAALGYEGSVGVIASEDLVGTLREALASAGVPITDADADDARVTVLPAPLAKGMEYDHVIVLEPASIAAAGVDGEPGRARGLRLLYVVLTRAVSRLVVLHTQPMPSQLLP